MSKKLSIEVVHVTPKMAETWLKKNHPENRQINPRTVATLAADIEAGNWRVTHQGICFNAEGYLIDGQHRLMAIISSKTAIDIVVATNPEGQLNDPIDRHRARSLAMLTGLNNKQIAAAKVLLGFEQGFEYANPLSPAQAIEVFGRHQASYDLLDFPRKDKLFGGVLAGLIWAAPVDARRVCDFGHKVSTGEMIKKGDPPFALRLWRERNYKEQPWAMAMATLSACRAYLIGKTTAMVFTTESGYRAVTTKRRAMKVPNTPGVSLVPSASMNMSGREDDAA